MEGARERGREGLREGRGGAFRLFEFPGSCRHMYVGHGHVCMHKMDATDNDRFYNVIP